MKQWIWIGALWVLSTAPTQTTRAQAEEVQQLILNVEKLVQYKEILQTMKQYYDILTTGYNAVRDIAKGNFSVHKVFLDGLLEVSPSVKKYKRIADIVDGQLQLIKEYKAALKRTRTSNLLNKGELDYLERVYGQLVDASLDNISDLTTVITAQQLRMSDEERLAAIDQIYDEITGKLTFLRQFNNQTAILLVQRTREKADVRGSRRIMGVAE